MRYWTVNGNGNDFTEMGENGNNNGHSPTPLLGRATLHLTNPIPHTLHVLLLWRHVPHYKEFLDHPHGL